MTRLASITICVLACACGQSSAPSGDDAPADAANDDDAPPPRDAAETRSAIKHVFVIAMENQGATEIYGNLESAPYINTALLPIGGRAATFIDRLPKLDSEPHYIWMEAGTNAFADHTFTNDDNPSASNSTADTQHLSTQITAAGSSWMSYQEGLDSKTGGCPIASSGNYAPKHDPFIFFRDVAGSPPSKTNAFCVAHHRTLAELGDDLASDRVAAYNFITPDLCHDMHTNKCAGSSDPIRQGDTWLSTAVPAILSYAEAHQGVLWIVWDEPVGSTGSIPMIVLGPHVKPDYASPVAYSHGSVVKSVEEILELPTLPRAARDASFADFFEAGYYP